MHTILEDKPGEKKCEITKTELKIEFKNVRLSDNLRMKHINKLQFQTSLSNNLEARNFCMVASNVHLFAKIIQ